MGRSCRAETITLRCGNLQARFCMKEAKFVCPLPSSWFRYGIFQLMNLKQRERRIKDCTHRICSEAQDLSVSVCLSVCLPGCLSVWSGLLSLSQEKNLFFHPKKGILVYFSFSVSLCFSLAFFHTPFSHSLFSVSLSLSLSLSVSLSLSLSLSRCFISFFLPCFDYLFLLPCFLLFFLALFLWICS